MQVTSLAGSSSRCSAWSRWRSPPTRPATTSPRPARASTSAYNLALLASLAVLAAGGMVTFLVAWETMAVAAYLVILRRPRREDVAAGAFWFLALPEIGFVLIVAAFVILPPRPAVPSCR